LCPAIVRRLLRKGWCQVQTRLQTRLWRGRRFDVVGWLLLGSVLLVWWRWSSLSWHARGMILAGYGVAFGLVMLLPALRTRGLLETGAQAEGTVVGTEEKTRTQRNDIVTYYYPTVRFTTPDGRQVVFTSGLGSPSQPQMGYRLRVRYRPDHPEQAELDRAATWMLRAAFGILGGLGLLVAGVVMYGNESESTYVSSGTYDHIDGTGQIQAVPASGRIGEMLRVYDEFGDAQLEVTVAQLTFSTDDPLGQPKHGLYMGAYVRLYAIADQPDELAIAALVAGRYYDGDAITGSTAFDPPLDYLTLESGERVAGWLVFDVPARHGQLVLRDLDEKTVGVWKY
jgi:uncharacterized protein DUF3592